MRCFVIVFYFSSLFVLCGFAENKERIPLGGNSYITKSAAGGISDSGFEDWSSPETVFSTFFRVNEEGGLRLSLEYSTEDDGNEIEVSCLGQLFQVALPKPVTASDTIMYVGEIDHCEPGYVRVDFKGKKKAGKTYAGPTALLVGGTAAKGLNYVGDFSFYWGRRGPSVHMSYQMPENETAEWFYNEVTVPVGDDPVGSYFMSNGFGEGYFGIQVNSETERRVLFSVWSPFETDDPADIPEEHKVKLVKKGDGVYTGEFGNEGSGGQSYLVYDWKAGATYRFLTRIRPRENGYSEYTAYFFAPESGKWKLIASFLRPGTATYYTSAHSFLENFSPDMGYVGRKAVYNNQWIYTTKGEWVELKSAKFSVDETGREKARMDFKGGVNEEGYYLENGGFLNDYTEPGSSFNKMHAGKRPEVNFEELEK